MKTAKTKDLKKFAAVFLSVIMTFASIIPAAAETTANSDNYEASGFTNFEDGNKLISGYKGDVIDISYSINNLKGVSEVGASLTYDTNTFDLYEGFVDLNGNISWYSLDENNIKPAINENGGTINYKFTAKNTSTGADCTWRELFLIHFIAKTDYSNVSFPVVTQKLSTIEKGNVLSEQDKYISVSAEKRYVNQPRYDGNTSYDKNDLVKVDFDGDNINTELHSCIAAIQYDTDYLELVDIYTWNNQWYTTSYSVSENGKADIAITRNDNTNTMYSEYYNTTANNYITLFFKAKDDIDYIEEKLYLYASTLNVYEENSDKDELDIVDAVDMIEDILSFDCDGIAGYYSDNYSYLDGVLSFWKDDMVELSYQLHYMDAFEECSSTITYNTEFLQLADSQIKRTRSLEAEYDNSANGIIKIDIKADDDHKESGLNIDNRTVYRFYFKVIKELDNISDAVSVNTSTLKTLKKDNALDQANYSITLHAQNGNDTNTIRGEKVYKKNDQVRVNFAIHDDYMWMLAGCRSAINYNTDYLKLDSYELCDELNIAYDSSTDGTINLLITQPEDRYTQMYVGTFSFQAKEDIDNITDVLFLDTSQFDVYDDFDEITDLLDIADLYVFLTLSNNEGFYNSDSDSPTGTEPSLIGLLGDLDNNGKVDSSDSLFVLRASVNLETLTNTQRILADVDNDSKISSSDSLFILRASVKLEDGLNIGTEKYIA